MTGIANSYMKFVTPSIVELPISLTVPGVATGIGAMLWGIY